MVKSRPAILVLMAQYFYAGEDTQSKETYEYVIQNTCERKHKSKTCSVCYRPSLVKMVQV